MLIVFFSVSTVDFVNIKLLIPRIIYFRGFHSHGGLSQMAGGGDQYEESNNYLSIPNPQYWTDGVCWVKRFRIAGARSVVADWVDLGEDQEPPRWLCYPQDELYRFLMGPMILMYQDVWLVISDLYPHDISILVDFEHISPLYPITSHYIYIYIPRYIYIYIYLFIFYLFIFKHTHTHSHTYVYIYIYIYDTSILSSLTSWFWTYIRSIPMIPPLYP